MTPTRKQLAVKLNSALHSVRADLDTCLEQYRLQMTARLADVIRILEGREPADAPRALPLPTVLKTMISLVEATKLKPHKGRGKDLKRIDDLVTKLLSQIRPGK